MVISLGHVKYFQDFTRKSCTVTHHSSGNISTPNIYRHITTLSILFRFSERKIKNSRCWRLFLIKLWNHGLVDSATINNCNTILENCRNTSVTNNNNNSVDHPSDSNTNNNNIVDHPNDIKNKNNVDNKDNNSRDK
jgi:hypothetical protein